MSKKKDAKQYLNEPRKVPEEETVTSLSEPVPALEVFDPESKSLVQSTSKELKKSFYKTVKPPEQSDTSLNVVYQMIYPDDLNLKPAPNSQKSRGRRKKPKIRVDSPPPLQKTKIKVVSKTRSGREVKFPKYIENEFKKIEINDDLPADSMEVKISDFVKYTETDEKIKSEVIDKIPNQPDLLQKKRRIAAQYRCPKCKKAYLGRNKILEHLKKNPSHGPMHQNEEKNFEVWNYLVNVTQKCPSSERGQKFCQELSNLLHNLLLLTNALFKKLGSAANEVKIDKVLGNAIGLTPGSYYFDDNNLYKNVTVLKLMANNDFLHSLRSKTEEGILKSTILSGTNCNCGKTNGIDEFVLKSMLISSETSNATPKQAQYPKDVKQNPLVDGTKENGNNLGHNDDNNINKFIGDEYFATSEVGLPSNFPYINEYEIKCNARIVDGNKNCQGENSMSKTKNVLDYNKKDSVTDKDNVNEGNNIRQEFFSPEINLENNFPVNDYEMKQSYNSPEVSDNTNTSPKEQKLRPSSPKIKIQSNILICPPKFIQKNLGSKLLVNQNENNKNIVNPELMTDNSVPIPNLRHSVDELMLPVSSEPGSVLDNSSSSDEVMNVDQFVNERFRKITESDLEVTNGSSLNLELPSLDLFQFHTS